MKKGLGADKSPFDIRTFSYKPDKANKKGGQRYEAKDIEDQKKVGICTSISLTQNARKATGIKYSADFQYLLQKKFVDGNWNEGSSLFSALKVARNYGLLPEKYWKHTTLKDRDLSYSKYVKKLQSISDEEIGKLLKTASKYKIEAYANVPVTRDTLANAIDESESGVLARFVIGKEWWTKPIEPLRTPKEVISGHGITVSNYDGGSFRIANSWGDDWADKGTAYYLHDIYRPTEAWIVYYKASEPVKKDLEKRELTKGQILDVIQKLLQLLRVI